MSSVLATYTDASSYRCPSGPTSSASSPLVSVRTSAPHAENSNTSCAYISQPLTLSVYTQCKTWKEGFTDLRLGSIPQITMQPPPHPPLSLAETGEEGENSVCASWSDDFSCRLILKCCEAVQLVTWHCTVEILIYYYFCYYRYQVAC